MVVQRDRTLTRSARSKRERSRTPEVLHEYPRGLDLTTRAGSPTCIGLNEFFVRLGHWGGAGKGAV